MEETSLYYLQKHVLTFHVSHTVLQNKLQPLQYIIKKYNIREIGKSLGNTTEACLRNSTVYATPQLGSEDHHTHEQSHKEEFLSNLQDGSGLVDDRNNT
jgi:hypothetical protein